MVRETVKDGNSTTKELANAFNMVRNVKSKVKLVQNSEVINTPKEDNNLDSDLSNDIFDEYDDIFKALVEKWQFT